MLPRLPLNSNYPPVLASREVGLQAHIAVWIIILLIKRKRNREVKKLEQKYTESQWISQVYKALNFFL
jgi:hypothetical protein